MPIVRCHRDGFTVADIERPVAFYRDVLGLELVRISERRNLPSYDQIVGHDQVVVARAMDPDGISIELFQEFEDVIKR
jgi:hypothetical protein